MKKSFIGVLAFATGSIIGFVAADKIMKQKYEQIVQDEIDSIKAAFRKEPKACKMNKANSDGTSGAVAERSQNSSENSAEEIKPTEKERRRYSQYTAELGYTKEEKPAPMGKPRVISPDEFGNLDEYEQVSLTCYSDGTVADDDDRAMSKDEVKETIGLDSLNHFGEYEEDSVFVRNDRLKVDYEILSDQRSYAEILEERPYLKH